MKITDSIAGVELPPSRIEATWRRCMSYAAALGDENPLYYDDTRPEPLAVHPVFAVALTWPLVSRLGEHLADRLPAEALARLVHASERIRWQRPLIPGDQLEIGGRVVAVVPGSAGTLLVLRLEARRPDGTPVFSEDLGGLLRAVDCDGPGTGREELPAGPAAAGPERWSEPIAIGPLAAQVYDGCSGIVFPIHTSRAFARAVGLDDVILQGTCTLGLAVSRLVAREAGGQPAAVRELGCEFRRPVAPGSTVRLQVFDLLPGGAPPGRDGRELGFEVRDQAGQPVIRRGFVRLAEPGVQGREP